MIQNRWKQVLEQKGMTQAEVADKAGLGKPFFSAVVNGSGVLSEGMLQVICDILGAEPTRIYSDDILKAIYGMDIKKQLLETVSIKLTGEDVIPFRELKDRMGVATNAEVVRFAINCGLELLRD